MLIENRSRLLGQIPKPLTESVKVSERLLESITGPELAKTPVMVVPGDKVISLQKEEFRTKSIIGKMAHERGIDDEFFITPSTLGAVEDDENNNMRLYLSSDALRPLYFLNRNDIHQRKDVSMACIYAFYTLSDLLLKSIPREESFPLNNNLVDHLIRVMPEFIDSSNTQNEPFLSAFSKDVESYMTQNRNKINVTVKGLEMNVYVEDEKAFSMFNGQDQALRTVIVNPLVTVFSQEMSLRSTWFSAPPATHYGVPLNDERMNFAADIIRKSPNINSIGDVFRLYIANEPAKTTIEELNQKLLKDKHSDDSYPEREFEDSWEEMEEEVSYNLKSNRSKNKKSIRAVRHEWE